MVLVYYSKSIIFILIIIILNYYNSRAQNNTYTPFVYENRSGFTIADSLRGNLNTNRSCYDVKYYDLYVSIDFNSKSIIGTNFIYLDWSFTGCDTIQLDLFSNLTIDKVYFNKNEVSFVRKDNIILVATPKDKNTQKINFLQIDYHGTPREAIRPPWDGGFVWKKDLQNNQWLGVACEGLGASSWWPLKDHLSDEPDSMSITISVPDSMTAISNGNLRKKFPAINKTGYTSFNWFVSYPINSYNVTLNVGDYVNIKDIYNGVSGKLDLDYYVISYNKPKVEKHFDQVKSMLDCFEKKFGPYPFYRDGYALVESDYWGMEHQGAIAYGNKFKNNKWGFDYIIVHESGHEWFGNNISANDHSDLWIHESFTTYSEAIFMECKHGYDKSVQYLISQLPNIENKDPIQGVPGVNFDNWKSSDMYYKGSWMLHTLRSVINDDEKWFKFLRSTYDKFRLSTISSHDMRNYMTDFFQLNLTPFFQQYLEVADLPVFEYKILSKQRKSYVIEYRWNCKIKEFNMPIEVFINKKKITLTPTDKFQKIKITSPYKPNILIYKDKYLAKQKELS